MITIEMCAYLAAHGSEDNPWRCVVCDKISKHDDDGIMRHLTEDHGLDVKRLKKEHKDGIFLYPEKNERLNQ